MEIRSRLLMSALQMALYLNFSKAYSRGNIEDTYIGCYYIDVNDRSHPQKITLQNNTTLTIEWCIGQCLLQNSTYAGLENSKECLCRNNLGVMLPDASCNSLCPGNQSEYCGGSNGHRAFYSLYTVCEIGYYGSMCDQVCHCRRRAPCDRLTGKCPKECEGKWFGGTCNDIHLSWKYIGCFRDNETRAISPFPKSHLKMTVEMCSEWCILKNNSIAGLQAGSHCSCGETYAKYGPLSEGNCSYQCSGNQSQKCGGAFANSVYSVCPAGYYGQKCRNQCHCYNRSRCAYLTGECNSTCKAGWTGNSCNIRDCTTKDGDCLQNEICSTINLNFATITGCRCSPGYDRNAFWEMCEGIVKDNYIGCYFDEPKYRHGRQKITLQNNTTLTIELCIGQCLLRNSTYAGIENSKECLCRNNFGVMLRDSSCNSLCPGNQSEYCGGSNGEKDYYSLYTVCRIGYYGDMCDQVCHCRRRAPCDRMTGKCPNECDGKWFGGTCSDIHLSEKYIGCFRDNTTRAIPSEPYSNSYMTVEFCTNMCALRNNSIAGLQAGSYCFCGENYARYGPLGERNCSNQCSGNKSQKCGGAFANSVYSVCPAGYYGPKCRNQCHCYNRSRCGYLTGECNSTCKAGWTGNSCNFRDCTTKDGDCFQNEICTTINLNSEAITGCRCSPGYDRKAFWEMCEDIDECVLGLCDASKTDCTNTVGGYNCTCKSGYRQYNETTCYELVKDNYIGCYLDESKYQHGRQKITLQNNTTLTIELCIGQCLKRNSTYAGLENSKECLCRNNIGVMLPDSSCNSPCPGNQMEYCGGSNGEKEYYSLYTVCQIGYYGSMCDQVCHCRRRAPCDRMTGKCPNECDGKWFGRTCSDIHLSENYIGCFRDASERAISSELYSNSIMTVEFCTNMCALRNNSIAGLQAGSFCFCGENYARYGPLGERNCSYQCSGNRPMSQKCGGAFANSVYSVCPAGYYGPKCYNQCHCHNRSRCAYLTGECNSTCKAGWIGNSCNLRDCTTKDGDCFQNETCTTINLNSETITGCRCSPGYDRKAFWETCEDIDECVLGLCDASKTDCTNTVGGYNCTCKSGYRQYNETTCYDIDECVLGRCGASTNDCTNTVGGYNCTCKSGYRQYNETTCYDIDECALQFHNCSNATEECNNNIGGFSCICKRGFNRNKATCEDIDECVLGLCDASSTDCTNTVGGYNCTCKSGYRQYNETTCYASNTGAVAGAVVSSVLCLALIVCIVLLMHYLSRRKRPKMSANQLEELPISAQCHESVLRDGVLGLYGEDPNTYEEIGYAAGDVSKTLHNKLSDPDSIKKEFQSVNLQIKDFCALGKMPEVKKKNRFINILPYESNRVILSIKGGDVTSQYINASYVQGYTTTTKFIATQGPREETLEDFWRMIIENRVHLIVMITNLAESQKCSCVMKKKCEKYWPDLEHPVVYGDITVTLSSEESCPDYTVRSIRCSERLETVELKQFHYLSWPDHDIPSDIKGFITFHRMVRQQMKPDKYTVVHCSAGAGRTGAFIAIDYLLEQEKVEHDVRILDCLKELRDQRSQMIQNLEQYVFVHNALLFAFDIGDTAILTNQFLSKYKQIQTKDAASGISALEKQFQFIERVQEESKETEKYRGSSNVGEQNKMKDMNAVFLQNWKLKNAYIYIHVDTQPADPLATLWELRRKNSCAVMIFIDPSPALGNSFLPTKDNPKTLSDCTLLCESMTTEDYGSRYDVAELKELEETTYANANSSDIYQNTGSILSKSCVTVLHVTEFAGKGSWDVNRLMSLYKVFSNITSEKTEVPVIVVSSDCSLSGFCLAAFNAFEMMKQDEMVDLYQIVLNIRKSKTELFNTMSSYVDLHDVVERYIVVSTA